MRVLCIDLDPQGNLTMSQGMNPDTIERSMFDVLVHRAPIAEVIAHREVDIAVASIDLAGADMALSSQIGRERALQKALADITMSYDYILIDTPPSLGLLTINAFVAATGVVAGDEVHEIGRLAGLAEPRIAQGLGPIAVMIRVTVGVEAHTHEFIATAHEDQKFGFSLAGGTADEAVSRVAVNPRAFPRRAALPHRLADLRSRRVRGRGTPRGRAAGP